MYRYEVFRRKTYLSLYPGPFRGFPGAFLRPSAFSRKRRYRAAVFSLTTRYSMSRA
jgi:hypothetical protein